MQFKEPSNDTEKSKRMITKSKPEVQKSIDLLKIGVDTLNGVIRFSKVPVDTDQIIASRYEKQNQT